MGASDLLGKHVSEELEHRKNKARNEEKNSKQRADFAGAGWDQAARRRLGSWVGGKRSNNMTA